MTEIAREREGEEERTHVINGSTRFNFSRIARTKYTSLFCLPRKREETKREREDRVEEKSMKQESVKRGESEGCVSKHWTL